MASFLHLFVDKHVFCCCDCQVWDSALTDDVTETAWSPVNAKPAPYNPFSFTNAMPKQPHKGQVKKVVCLGSN